MADYRVQLQVFEGPLDLLLYLIKKEEVDIYEVDLTKIAAQFIEYIELMRQLDLDVAGEFLVMAATLMYIKSRELLPVDQQVQGDAEDEEGLDPRWELIRQLVEYKKFKEMASHLQGRELHQEGVYPHPPGPLDPLPALSPGKSRVSLLDLLNAVNEVLKRVPEKGNVQDIYAERWTVSEKIEVLRRQLARQARLRFTDLFQQAADRVEVVTIFLALLELVRLKQVLIAQSDAFGEIEIGRAPERELELPTDSPASTPAHPDDLSAARSAVVSSGVLTAAAVESPKAGSTAVSPVADGPTPVD
jgi:segregation and condensation protein A